MGLLVKSFNPALSLALAPIAHRNLVELFSVQDPVKQQDQRAELALN
jgi:hypothetical protein